VHGDKLHPGLFSAARQLGGVVRSVVPAKPHLQRHRNARRLHHCVDQRERVVEIAHQRGAGRAVGHVLRRATHIDVDDGRAGAFRNARALRHPVRLAAGKLNDMQSGTVIGDTPARDVLFLVFVLGERRARGHFRNDEAGAERRRLPAERRVGYAGHRRQQHRIRQFDGTDRKTLHARLS
jgi:hypothetical protein